MIVGRMKDRIKNCKVIVGIYELVMEPVHKGLRKTKELKKKFVRTRFSYGTCNQDKVFYLITSDVATCGLFSLILVNVLPFLKIGEKKGYIPIVDYKNTVYLPMIQDVERYGKENPWEYYFEQPGGNYTLDEVYKSAKIEVGNQNKYGFQVVIWNDMMPMPMKDLNYWSRIANKYIRPTAEICKRIEDEKKKLFPKDGKIMGVSIRAAYRWSAMLKNDIIKDHPKVASCEYYMEMIQKKMHEWGYDLFLLACEDREYVTKMEKRFGEKCCHMDRRYRHMFENDVPVSLDYMEEIVRKEFKGISVTETTIEYIVETYLLASCDSLYSTIGGGAQFAYIVNGGKYKNLEVYNEGLY